MEWFHHGLLFDCRMVPWNGFIMGFYLIGFEATAMFLCLPREPIWARKIAVGRPIRLRGLAVLLSGLFVFGFIGRAVERSIGAVGLCKCHGMPWNGFIMDYLLLVLLGGFVSAMECHGMP